MRERTVPLQHALQVHSKGTKWHSNHSGSEEESQYDSDENENSDKIENLEHAVDSVSRATEKSVSELEFLVKLILGALPPDVILKLRAYGRESDRHETIKYFLNDMVKLENDNKVNRGTSAISGSAGVGEMESGRQTARGSDTVLREAATAVGTIVTAAPTRTVAVPDVRRQGPQPQLMDTNSRNRNPDDRANSLQEQTQLELRKRNIIVKGLHENLSDCDQGAVHRMLDSMNLGYLKGRDYWARRIGREDSNRPRILVVTFECERQVEQIINEKTRLMWTSDYSEFGNFSNVFIEPDLPREERQKKYRERRDQHSFRESNERGGFGQRSGVRDRNDRNEEVNMSQTDSNDRNTIRRTVSSPALGEGSLSQLIPEATITQATQPVQEAAVPDVRRQEPQLMDANSRNRDPDDRAVEIISEESNGGNGNIDRADNLIDETSNVSDRNGNTNASNRDTENLEVQGSTVRLERLTEQPVGADYVWSTPRKLLSKAINQLRGKNIVEQGNEVREGATTEH